MKKTGALPNVGDEEMDEARNTVRLMDDIAAAREALRMHDEEHKLDLELGLHGQAGLRESLEKNLRLAEAAFESHRSHVAVERMGYPLIDKTYAEVSVLGWRFWLRIPTGVLVTLLGAIGVFYVWTQGSDPKEGLKFFYCFDVAISTVFTVVALEQGLYRRFVAVKQLIEDTPCRIPFDMKMKIKQAKETCAFSGIYVCYVTQIGVNESVNGRMIVYGKTKGDPDGPWHLVCASKGLKFPTWSRGV